MIQASGRGYRDSSDISEFQFDDAEFRTSGLRLKRYGQPLFYLVILRGLPVDWLLLLEESSVKTFRGRNLLKAVILAAGYAKRLLPLTADRPKSLLSVAGKRIIERVLDSLAPVQDLESIYIVTNNKFYSAFRDWMAAYRSNNVHLNIIIINNESDEFEQKFGAIGNLHLVLRQENIYDDIIVMAADNLFSETLEGFATYSRQMNAPVVAVHTIDNLDDSGKYGAIEFDNSGRITYFKEKPVQPKTLTIGVALYYYPKSTLEFIREYMAEGNNSEEPGRLVEWMYKVTPFYTWKVPAFWCDVGSIEKLDEANRIFAEMDSVPKASRRSL